MDTMSHIDKLKALFTEIGLKFTEFRDEDYYKSKWVIIIDQGAGYGGFEAMFEFTLDGQFVSHAVYE